MTRALFAVVAMMLAGCAPVPADEHALHDLVVLVSGALFTLQIVYLTRRK